jgi:hypothetical protein
MAGKRKSGKGKKCPACGEAKFQKRGQVFKCSGCSHVGFYDKAPPHPGGGKGDFCHICKSNTLHKVYNRTHRNQRLTLYNCRGCGSVVFTRRTGAAA